MDPQEILDKLPQNAVRRLKAAEEGINAPFRPKGGNGVSVTAGRHLSRPVVVVVGLLLLGALAVVLMPARPRDANPAVDRSATDTLPTQPMVSEVPAGVPVPADVPQGSASSVAVPAGMVALAPPVVMAPAGPAVAASAAMVSPAATPVAIKPLPAASVSTGVVAVPVADGVLVLKAKASTWVQVTDAKGVVQLSKTLAAGEAVTVSGTLPLAAIVGRADATEVQVRGKAFDLLLVSKDNVARFEVK